MNREIKFRAYDTYTKTMLPVVDIIKFTKEEGINILRDSTYRGVGICIPYHPHIELMQYTGLKDKNGIEIYEGDIVISILRLDNGIFLRRNTDVVEWNEEESSFMLGKKKRHFHNNLELEVIGNIYENPELLKESEK